MVQLLPFLAVLALLALPGAAAGEEQLVDGIAAQVGSDIVLVSEVTHLAAPVEKKMREAGSPEAEIDRMRAEILERMIERRLLEQAVRRTEIDASEAEVDQAIEGIAKQNGLTVDQLKKTVTAKGMTYESYRDQLRGEIQRQKLVNGAVASRVHIDEDDIRKRYEQRYADQPEGGEEVRLRHLLIPFESDDPDAHRAVCAKVEAARQRALAGEDFAALAREMSVLNPDLGGDTGWVHVQELAAWMREPVAALQPGQTSDVIERSFGCNLLHLVERRHFEKVTYEEAREKLYHQLFDERMDEEYSKFIEKLRAQTYIERKGVFASATPSLTEDN